MLALTSTIPFSFFAVVDQNGANDVPLQSDLTQMGRENSDATMYRLFWSWNSTNSWTGSGGTGDACALFDATGKGMVDFAVCGQVTNQNGNPSVVVQTAGSPFVFSCGGKRNDRCANSVPVSYTASQVQAGVLSSDSSDPNHWLLDKTGNLITATDPFTAGASDSTLQINILKSFLPKNARLVNVCSYPSAGNGGNNNAFDCVVSPGGGFLVIKKDAGDGVTAPNFTFNVNPVSVGQAATYTIAGTGQTSPIGLALGTASESVTETQLSNWTLDSASCALESGASTGTRSGSSVNGISINSGEVTTCTFVNKTAGVSLLKTASPTTVSLGTTITYSYKVTNTGGVPFTAFTVSDLHAGLSPITCSGVTSLAAGGFTTCTATYVVKQSDVDAGSIYNLGNVSATTSIGSVTATSDVTLPVAQTKGVTINKTSNATASTKVGDTITYSYPVTNTGNTTISSLSVTDPHVGLSAIDCKGVTNLAPGATVTCTATYVVQQSDVEAGKIDNTGTVNGTTTIGAVTASKSLTVTLTRTSGVSIVKSSNASASTKAGDTITYSYAVKNTGNTTISSMVVTDDKLGAITCPATLAAGASTTCTATYVVQQSDVDAGKIVNKVVVNGTTTVGPVTDTKTLTVTIAQTYGVSIVKSSNATSATKVGDTITYSYALKNTGNTTISSMTVTDDKLGAITCPTSLAAGASATCTATYVVKQSDVDAGKIVNKVVVNGTTSLGPVTDTKTLTVTLTQHPHVSYVFTMTNDGNVTQQVTVPSIPGVTWANCTAGQVFTLAPGAVQTCNSTPLP
jgi:uncharacterized repeat protein (TIGR01451 family)